MNKQAFGTGKQFCVTVKQEYETEFGPIEHGLEHARGCK